MSQNAELAQQVVVAGVGAYRVVTRVERHVQDLRVPGLERSLEPLERRVGLAGERVQGGGAALAGLAASSRRGGQRVAPTAGEPRDE